LVIDLPALVDRFATEFDALPEIIEGLPSARMLISIGRLVSRVVVYGRDAPDGTIDLIGTTSIFRTEWPGAPPPLRTDRAPG